MQDQPRGYLARPSPSSLADVVDVILDRGLVIDAYVRVSVVGIELLTLDARIAVASLDTYLRFAEAVNRLDLLENRPPSLLEVALDAGGQVIENIAANVVERKVDDMVETVTKPVGEAMDLAEGLFDRATDALDRATDALGFSKDDDEQPSEPDR